MDYIENENKYEQIKKENQGFLRIFQEELEKKGLSEKTIRSHLGNVDFYINSFLLYSEPIPMKDGIDYVDEFLGEFFIRKCMWSTPATIKGNAASLKKFYKCMADYGEVGMDEYKYLCELIRDNMEIWQEDCRIYNDPDQENPFFPF